MRILNKEISFYDFLPHALFRMRRNHLYNKDLWRKWQMPAVPVLLYFSPELEAYSQFGEDLIFAEIFRNQSTGRFIDVGANHPTELNNTYRLYKAGWRGVNIEPGDKMYQLLSETRSEDTNLQVGCGKDSGSATFYEMDVDSVSTFNKSEAKNSQYNKNIIAQKEVKVITLADIFSDYFKDSHCDLLSIDVEGDNLDVLEGNNWKKYRPSYIIIEMPAEERLGIIPYLYENGYYLIFDNSLNGIFKDSGSPGPHAKPTSLEMCLTPQQNPASSSSAR